MNLNWKLLAAIGVGGALLLVVLSWLLFGGSAPAEQAPLQTFGTGDNRTTIGTENETPVTAAQSGIPNASAKIFKITDGPVAGATFVQTQNPTTTIARYILADNGRAFDQVIDSPGAIPRAVSNTTIPGVARVVWTDSAGSSQAGGAILQYIDKDVVKTLSLGLPAATTSMTAAAVPIQFLPNNISDVATSPEGESVVYLLRTTRGSDGYIARFDGSGAKKLFSLPLSHLLLTWPSQNTIIAYSAPAYGVEGVAFTIDARSGTTGTLLQALGLSLTGDPALSRILYHTTGGSAGRVTYSHDVKNGLDLALSFDPLPEQCIWSTLASSTAYCAAAAVYVAENYSDLRRTGEAAAPQQILSYDQNSRSSIVAVPGGADGGVASDIDHLALSLDEHYLLFIKKGDRSLWGVRLPH